ncbi:hypothetical protein ACFWE5_04160 [Cellulosimicrobium funkei]|uniref:hypothetical protein n=1 Tax=Cellulosimicrobium funkei TaxID=264251 RepID=UPI0005E2FEFF|nr:Uncharacterised protein [Mycobacteroides abscessus]
MSKSSTLPAGVPDLGVTNKPGWETVTALITVKAYPVIGRKTGESVCVAGVRLDGAQPRWIRLFPVPFRELPKNVQFKKYSIVQLRARRSDGHDRRPESMRPDLSTLRVGGVITSDRSWRERWDLMEPLVGATSACRLIKAARAQGQVAPSLGLVRPTEVLDVVVTDNAAYEPSTGVGDLLDADLFGNTLAALEASPFVAKYRYRCAECSGGGHEQSIIDWEAGELSRRLLRDGRTPREARDAIRAKFLQQMAGASKDTHFYLGNQHQNPGTFMVLGVFWPPRWSRPAPQLF